MFYDINGAVVEILAVVPKSEADEWLAGAGESEKKEETDEEGRTL